MSKYQELCQTLQDTRAEWRSFKAECIRLGEQLVHGFVHYMDVPEERWRVLPPDVKPETMELPYSIATAMRLTEEGHWVFLLQIDLLADGATRAGKASGIPTLQPMLFPIKIGKKNRQSTEFEVCLADKTCRKVHDGLPSEFTELFDAAYALIRKQLDEQLDTFLADSHTLEPRKIGFV